ncbi:MAG: hypothetical protein K2X27_22205, partial [Candidatus Obscuribacterales bacterium]|nr:hypothetical protein [Candidatus Obscuribacterales bacterium]
MASLINPSAQKQSSIRLNQTKLFLKSSPRSQQGSLIVEGVVGTWLVITAVALAVLFLVNCGMATYYKQRLGYITDQVATLAANEIASPMFTSSEQTEANTR